MSLSFFCTATWLPPQPVMGLEITQVSPASLDEAERFYQRGILYFLRNQLDQAEANWTQSLEQYRQRQDAQGQLQSLEGLGLVHQRLNRLSQALQTFEVAKVLAKELGDRPRLANTLGNLGNLYQRQGQYQLANQHYEAALELYQDLGDQRRQGLVLTNLANLQAALGQYKTAQSLFQQSLVIAQQVQDVSGKLSALSSLGLVQASQGRYLQAENAYYQALKLSRSFGDRPLNPETEATLLYNLGSLEHAQERLTQAIGYYQQGLEAAPTTSTLVQTLRSNLALIQAERGQTAAAIASLQSNIQTFQAGGDRIQASLQQGNLGYVHWRAGQLPQAEAVLKTAIAQREDIWNDLTTDEEDSNNGHTDLDQVSLFDTQLHPYNLLQQVLIAQNKPEEALLVAERSRARAFAALVARQFGSNSVTESVPTIEALKQLARDRQATLVEYAVIPDETFIAQGKLRGEAKAIYIWVIQPNGTLHFRQVDLTPLRNQGKTLQQLIRAARCFDSNRLCNKLLTSQRSTTVPTQERDSGSLAETRGGDRNFQFKPPPPSSSPPAEQLPSGSTPTDSTPVTTQHYKALQQVHQLLIDPIEDLLPQSPQTPVVIIPHDVLFLLPFSALQNSEGEFLIDRHGLSYAPSLQILQLIPTANPKQRWSNSLLVGNPTMPALPPKPGAKPQPLSPLPGAESEVRAIAKEMRTHPIMGAAATEQSITQQLSQASWIHLATHGLLDYGLAQSSQASRPTLLAPQGSQQRINPDKQIPGAIALAPSLKNPGPHSDGLLTANEIIQLKIQAELVVLSACDTGRGEITGDGVVGLSRAWLGAGAKGVLVSLWAVPDDATAKLMEQLYKQLNQGHSQSEALRLAMLATRQEYPNPRQWAAFSLMGSPPSPRE